VFLVMLQNAAYFRPFCSSSPITLCSQFLWSILHLISCNHHQFINKGVFVWYYIYIYIYIHIIINIYIYFLHVSTFKMAHQFNQIPQPKLTLIALKLLPVRISSSKNHWAFIGYTIYTQNNFWKPFF